MGCMQSAHKLHTHTHTHTRRRSAHFVCTVHGWAAQYRRYCEYATERIAALTIYLFIIRKFYMFMCARGFVQDLLDRTLHTKHTAIFMSVVAIYC